MSNLISVSDAQELLLGNFISTETEMISLDGAFRRVLAEDIHSKLDLPPFSNSSMDGYAVRASDIVEAAQENPVSLVVVGDAPAGQVQSIMVLPGQAMRIMTGAPLPAGSDTVVPVEHTRIAKQSSPQGLPETVEVLRAARRGDSVRPAGQDVRKDELVLTQGTRLEPQHIGMIAMLGHSQVAVYRKPRVAVFSSGDELVPVGGTLLPGQIFDSNTSMLVSLLEKYSAEVTNLGVSRDNPGDIRKILERAVRADVDLILSSAGVSVGAFDYIRTVLQTEGKISLWRVNMRPGKPMTFGSYKNVPYIGLPGNPVSAFVGFEVFVRPVLMKLQGMRYWQRPLIQVEIEESIESDGRESYLRAIIRNEQGKWLGRLTGHQGSGNLRSLVQANALLLIPSEVKSLPVGSQVYGWLLDD